jgi:hypothetical protein
MMGCIRKNLVLINSLHSLNLESLIGNDLGN